jgi:beta-N-acetylhexosaminidase
VYRMPGNFIDRYQRSYSSNPSTVAALGSAFIAAQQRTGVAATAKHFPGLGAAESGQDTDERPVTLDTPLRELRDVDELPYHAAIAAGVRLVMVSWALYPALDPHLPAGLSPAVTQGELRGRLGFRGVTATDALGAGALQAYGTLSQRGVLAARAGADLLICSVPNQSENSPTAGVSVLKGLTGSLNAGRLSLGDAREADERIIALRTAY